MLLSPQPCPGGFGHVRSIEFLGAAAGVLSGCPAVSLCTTGAIRFLLTRHLWNPGTLTRESQSKAQLHVWARIVWAGPEPGSGQPLDNPGSHREAKHGTCSERPISDILNFSMMAHPAGGKSRKSDPKGKEWRGKRRREQECKCAFGPRPWGGTGGG